ncbi:hypothetical protein KIPB_016212, partial [Kipferlia bialata]
QLTPSQLKAQFKVYARYVTEQYPEKAVEALKAAGLGELISEPRAVPLMNNLTHTVTERQTEEDKEAEEGSEEHIPMMVPTGDASALIPTGSVAAFMAQNETPLVWDGPYLYIYL